MGWRGDLQGMTGNKDEKRCGVMRSDGRREEFNIHYLVLRFIRRNNEKLCETKLPL